MSRAAALRVERVPRRRGAFGLDDRRRPDPVRVETEILAFLRETLPEVWAMPASETGTLAGRTILLLLARGHAAVLRIEPDAQAPSAAARTLAVHCRARAIPAAVVASLADARSALRRFGIEPRPLPLSIPEARSFGRCRAKQDP